MICNLIEPVSTYQHGQAETENKPAEEDSGYQANVAGQAAVPFTLEPEALLSLDPATLERLIQAVNVAHDAGEDTFMFKDAKGTEFKIGTEYAFYVAVHYSTEIKNGESFDDE